jgi:PsbP
MNNWDYPRPNTMDVSQNSMKHLTIAILLTFSIDSYSQELVIYRDTVNMFSIGIPIGWRYGTLKDIPSIKLFAQEATAGSNGLFANYNINIFGTADSTFEMVYSNFLSSLSNAKDFQLIDSGNVAINDRSFKWIIETHENKQAPIKMCNYDLITYKDRKAYVLTLVAPDKVFEAYKGLFAKVAHSLKL